MAEALNPQDGTRISYDVSGQGPGVVLLHGSALSRAMWRGLGYLKVLAEEFQVVRIDLRGHGRSAKPHSPQAYGMPLVVADVLAVMDDVGLGHAAVVGYSFGGRVGFSLAASAPGRVRRLATLGGTYRTQSGEIAKVFFEGYLDALRERGMQGFVDGMDLDPSTRAAFLANDARAMTAYFERTETEPGLSELVLRQLALPTLLLAGTRDRQRLEDSRAAASLMPDARCVPLPGRTHGSTLFPPEEVLAELLPFLRG